MPPFEPDKIDKADRRDVVFPILFIVLSFLLLFLPVPAQQRVSAVLRGSVLLPFIWTQESVHQARVRTQDMASLQARFDTAVAVVSAQRTLVEENERLRSLLGLRERSGLTYVPASATRPGTPGSEGMFLLDVGSDDGVVVNAPVIVAEGLVGVIREVGPRTALAMDWTHPDFRVSVMTVDGGVFGVAEPRAGAFRGGDRLILNSIPFHTPVEPGAVVVTSGVQGAVYPRGIMVGTIADLAEEDASDAGWRRSYWLEPAAVPAGATHVLVLTGQVEGGGASVGDLWVTIDTLAVLENLGGAAPEGETFDQVPAATESGNAASGDPPEDEPDTTGPDGNPAGIPDAPAPEQP
ncbi:MAG: rod shape-determining protein MreC [Gemmatimonadota bacterium]